VSSDAAQPQTTLDKYRDLAADYDRRTRRLQPYRERAIQRLLLRSGETVLDVACGTGANFSLLEKYVGPRGRIVGVDLSPEMLECARERADHHRWRNVDLIEGSAEELAIDGGVDAALFSFTHDVLRSRAAVTNVLGNLVPGGRVAAAGSKWAPRWAWPVNLVVRATARRYVTTYEGFRRPWSRLEDEAGPLHVESLAFGAVYVASGTVLQR